MIFLFEPLHEGLDWGHRHMAAVLQMLPATPPTLCFLRPPQPTDWLCKWSHHFGGPTAEQRAHL